MIELARLGGINYHPSLLPKYRGGTAMNWAVINGETETGVTIHQIDEGIDSGPMPLQEKVTIDPDDTVKSLYFKKLYPLGVRMVGKAVRLIREGKPHPGQGNPGRVIGIIDGQGFTVATGDGTFWVERVQYQSNAKIPSGEFICTNGLKIGDLLETAQPAYR